MKRLFLIFIAFFAIIQCQIHCLDVTSDEDLLNYIRKDQIVVLFSKKNCDDCDRLEKVLDSIVDDLQKLQNPTKAIKVLSSNLVRLYSPSKEPAIVFFRRGTPLLVDHDIAVNADTLLMHLTENEEPVVKELTDATFEHLTQASTGATTGDWLVFFYSQKCVDCQRLNALWEGVGANLKLRMNTARVNIETGGVDTGKRFGIEKAPEFVLIRLGKFYRYPMNAYGIKAFVSFATQGFKNAKAEKIRVAESPFDNLVSKGVNVLKLFVEMTNQVKREFPITFLAIIGFVIIVCILLTMKRRSERQQVKDKRRKAK
ncbi:thioredoxin domain-containing protein isoform X1 [Culicoides brevitarsis]|uniref:thioredoxin domain-containing protein isoform X1 n=1 Tax=Culicoides brevitarsis TaxID=469753 RepID=UPI00307C5412